MEDKDEYPQTPDSPFLETPEEGTENFTTCTYEGQNYQKGDTICKNRTEYKCGNNGWFKTGNSCTD
jgi:hypothetical protein